VSLNISNCPKCGKVFARGMKDVCPACVKEIDNEYLLCANFLRDNKGATLYELSEATKVSVKQITKFIREGRIYIYDAPNLGYPCEICGTAIREGGMCDDCRRRLTKDVEALKEQERVRKEEEFSRKNSHTYKSLDKK
jgi:flagellar operon protein (TIGR03826 family)